MKKLIFIKYISLAHQSPLLKNSGNPYFGYLRLATE